MTAKLIHNVPTLWAPILVPVLMGSQVIHMMVVLISMSVLLLMDILDVKQIRIAKIHMEITLASVQLGKCHNLYGTMLLED
jgi:hypothetical protein